MSGRPGTSSRLDALIRQRLGARRVERRAIPARQLTRVELSPVQRQLLAFQTLRPDSSALQIDVVVDVRGALDVARLDRAFAALCERHPALRSRIDGKHWVIDELDRDAVALAAGTSDALDITRRLCRAHLVCVGPDHHQLLLRLHHLAVDGASIEIMLTDLAALYAGTAGPTPALWPTDYAAWLWDEIQTGQRDAARNHWQATFARLASARRLPSAGEAASEGVLAEPIALTGEALRRTRDVMVSARSSLVGVVSAAINVLLHQWFDVAPVALEVSVANRMRGELDGVVGSFAGAAPVVVDVASATRIGEVIEEVQAGLAAANEHGEYPLERVPGADVWSGGFGRRVCISVQAASAERRAGGVVFTARTLRSPAPQYDLSFDVLERSEEVVVQLEGRAQFLDAWRTSAMSEDLAQLFERIGRMGLDARVRDVPARWSSFVLEPVRGPAETLDRRFTRIAAEREHALAVVAGDVALTYGELRAHSARLANCLRAMGIARGHTVVLYLDRSHWSPIAILGTLMAGATYVPLDASAPSERNTAIVAEVGASLELATPGATVRASAIAIDALALADHDDTPPACAGEPDDTAYVIYTSGSTGRPKGVAVSHDHVGRVVDAARAHFAFEPADVWSVFHSFTFDFSVWEMWGALSAGGAMVIVPHWVMRSPRELATLLARHHVTVVNQTPGALYALATDLAATGTALPALRHVLVGGEAVVPRRFEAWAARSGPGAATLRVSNIYGITEAVMVSTWWTTSLREFARTDDAPIGSPGIGCELLLLDRHLAPVPRGAVGEIYLGNIALAKGYWRRPDLTAAAFVPHPERAGARLYRSGDLARTDAAGRLVYVARRDRQVQVRGYRVELGEIETVLRQCGELNDVWVDADEKGELVGYVVPRPDATLDANVAREIALRHLPRHLVPARFVVVDAFPLTDNGKVDATRLRACHPTAAATTSRAPATATEQKVAAMWQRVLGLAEVGADDNFFALGGHSLAAAELVYEIREVTGKDLSIQQFFEAQSLSDLARRIDASAGVASTVHGSEIAPAPAQDRYPASQAQTVLFTTSQSAQSARAYTLPYAYRLLGEVDEAALAAAWRDVVERFETLRTAVVLDGDQVWQHVLPVDASRAALDIMTAVDVEAAARCIADDADEPFDLARGEVVRPVLYRCADGYVLGLTVHHIAVDGFAWGRIMADLEAAYRARRAGEHPLLAEVRLHYRDFAVWEAQQLASGAFESHRQFWRAYGAGCSTDPGLAVDRTSGGVSFRAALVERHASRAFAAGLRTVAADAGVTLLAVLMATYSAALARLGTRGNLLIGCVLSGRYRPELDDVVGLFANVLPLRSHAAESDRFATCVARMHVDLAAAQAHQALPLNQVLAELRAGGATAPRLHVTLSYQPREMTGPTSTFEPVALAARALQYDLHLRVDDVDDALRFTAMFNPDRLAEAAVAQLLADMEDLGARVAADPAVAMTAIVPTAAFAGMRW